MALNIRHIRVEIPCMTTCALCFRPNLLHIDAGVLGGVVAAIVALTKSEANADVMKYAGKTQVRSISRRSSSLNLSNGQSPAAHDLFRPPACLP